MWNIPDTDQSALNWFYCLWEDLSIVNLIKTIYLISNLFQYWNQFPKVIAAMINWNHWRKWLGKILSQNQKCYYTNLYSLTSLTFALLWQPLKLVIEIQIWKFGGILLLQIPLQIQELCNIAYFISLFHGFFNRLYSSPKVVYDMICQYYII